MTTNWASALCAQVDSEIFFPDKGGSNRPARALCRACPLTVPCLEEALLLGPDVLGIWGGTTEKERRKLRPGQVAA